MEDKFKLGLIELRNLSGDNIVKLDKLKGTADWARTLKEQKIPSFCPSYLPKQWIAASITQCSQARPAPSCAMVGTWCIRQHILKLISVQRSALNLADRTYTGRPGSWTSPCSAIALALWTLAPNRSKAVIMHPCSGVGITDKSMQHL